MRQKKKKEEVTRIRNLVGMFLSVMACKQALQFTTSDASSEGTRKRVVIACVAGRRRREARRKTIPLASSFAFGSRVTSRDDSPQLRACSEAISDVVFTSLLIFYVHTVGCRQCLYLRFKNKKVQRRREGKKTCRKESQRRCSAGSCRRKRTSEY